MIDDCCGKYCCLHCKKCFPDENPSENKKPDFNLDELMTENDLSFNSTENTKLRIMPTNVLRFHADAYGIDSDNVCIKFKDAILDLDKIETLEFQMAEKKYVFVKNSIPKQTLLDWIEKQQRDYGELTKDAHKESIAKFTFNGYWHAMDELKKFITEYH